MRWNDHSRLAGTHAYLSASKPTWLNKTEDELIEGKRNSYAQQIGTLIHAYAADCVKYREKLKKSGASAIKLDLLRNGIPEYAIDIQRVYPTVMSYVNDAIGFGLDPEVILYYSNECYGTADAINLDGKILRIHDLKTGVSPVKMEQLLVYASLFYLEYGQKPKHIPAELRIYQMGEIIVHEPEPEEIEAIMQRIIYQDKVLQSLRQEV